MEVATTNNHNQSHHHRMPHHLSLSGSSGAAGAGGSGGARSPFQREVREWQRIDPDTGALMTGRLEADRWINGPLNSYGKISDSQNISQPNGTQHTQRKQLEVLQARTAGGAMQVIRAHTVQTTSSRWSSNGSSSSSPVTMLTNGNSNSTNVGSSSFTSGHNSLFHNHSHYLSPHLAETNTRWPQLPQIASSSSGVDICEVSSDVDDDDDDDNDVDDESLEDQHYLINGGGGHGSTNGSSHFSNRHSFSNNNNKTSSSNTNSHNNIGSSNLLLLDTAPSLKLSNLMKSSSSISSNNSSSNNSTIAPAATMNTHKSASKISLHAIVGNNSDTKPSSSSASATTATTAATSWQQQQQQQRSSRLFEQPALYGNSTGNNSRVGVTDCDEAGRRRRCGGGGGVDVGGDDDLRHCNQSDELTPTHLNRQPRRDLESFRHYNDHGTELSAHGDDDDEDLRLTSRHQRRQQIPFGQNCSPLQRSRSISTDDLSTEWDTHGGATEEPGEWRRVSKLRRSFQSTSTKANKTHDSPTTQRRPLDLPTNSVSVSKIRAELENGRRLNTAMRNNHVDLAALDTILNGPSSEAKSALSKRSTFLTAESLKEIRGKLKKLSDESLYKDDFMANLHQQLPSAEEQIEVQDVKKLPDRRLRQLTPEQSPEISPPKSAFQYVARQQPQVMPVSNFLTQRLQTTTGQKHTTNSLESRQKNKDTTSADWHSRRKSYGFEKMSPPDDKTMFGMDASTDSGLGRSGELGNWSPTESTPAVRATVIHFGEPAKIVSNNALVQKRYRPLKTTEEGDSEEAVMKRHSIAVDESQYVRDNLRKTSQVHLNGFYDSSNETTKSLQPTRFDVMETSQTQTTSSSLFHRTQQKRVEFCKTEVHFAAESGRVNIVETDGKPPPTNNFRRRRRTTSGPLQSLVKSATTVSTSSSSSSNASSSAGTVALPITHFGDDRRRKTIASTMVAYKASLVDSQEIVEPTNVTVSIPKLNESSSSSYAEGSRSSYASTSGVDTTDGETDEISAIRGILKNKPIKPKPYHLGENIESPDALWGVQLKPVAGASGAGASLTTSRHESFPNALKADSPPSSSLPNKSVAERVRIVEKRQDHSTVAQSNGYSTKINLSLGESHKDWTEAGVHNLTQRRPSAQELMLQDLREHQRILDEGLKSTSLIIKTMRSASEFDEAMRRLSIASMEATVVPTIVVPTPMLRSNSYQESTRRYSTTSLDSNDRHVMKSASYTSTTSTTSSRRFSTDLYSSFVQPVPAPRLKLLGNTEIPVSQQLSQLRRMYEVAAASQEEDSADEEVKSYFRGHHDNSDSGGGTQESSSLEDDRSVEYSSSWSRLKAKRTVWKIEADDCRKQAKTLERAELPKSNVMSIELHSPHAALEKSESLKVTQAKPVAKPRTISSVQRTEQPHTHTTTTVKQVTQHLANATEPIKAPLKIIKEARGARKLREHELSYFGVQVAKNDANEAKTKLLSTTPRRTLPHRKLSADSSKTSSHTELKSEKLTTKWQLINDKPDLLRHSPIAVEPQVITRTAEIKPTERKSLQQQTRKHRCVVEQIPESEEDHQEEEDDDDDDGEHFYENITNEITPVFKVQPATVTNPYDRKMDLKRDAMILSEMTRNADQTLKALTDEAAIKDQRRRSQQQRRNSKPLETIDEKSICEKINDSCIAVKVTRSTMASEAKRTPRTSTPSPTTVASRARTSSQSSAESCPRARSRSLSSEREYENIKVRPTRTAAVHKSKQSKHSAGGSRSSSLDSQRSSHTQCSSGDEVLCKRDERLRSKTKRISSSSASTLAQTREKRTKEHHERTREKQQQQMLKDEKSRPHRSSHTDKQGRSSGSTAHSSQRERTECSMEAIQQPSSHHHSSLSRSAELSSGSSQRRPRRDEHDLQKSTRSLATQPASREKHGSSSSRLVRSSRGHEHETSQRSSHRSERADKEKDKLTRSKGHSSRSTSHNNSERHPAMQQTPSTKPREHKKSAATTTTTNGSETKHHDTMTHGKNAQLINGHQNGYQHHQHPHQHIHNMTTTTIAAKQRERNGKDRK